ncbi:MAG: hypothetical protein EBT10_04365, partial [Methylocystaceae bacterium]|nr:hypothetical protein [Methylocystaceae bacterium]
MQKLSLLASVALIAVMNVGASQAQTWSLPASSTAAAPAGKSETDLLAEALRNLENAQKLNARPEIEAAIKALASVVQKSSTGASAASKSSNDPLLGLIKDAKQWVSPTGDYANTR